MYIYIHIHWGVHPLSGVNQAPSLCCPKFWGSSSSQLWYPQAGPAGRSPFEFHHFPSHFHFVEFLIARHEDAKGNITAHLLTINRQNTDRLWFLYQHLTDFIPQSQPAHPRYLQVLPYRPTALPPACTSAKRSPLLLPPNAPPCAILAQWRTLALMDWPQWAATEWRKIRGKSMESQKRTYGEHVETYEMSRKTIRGKLKNGRKRSRKM